MRYISTRGDAPALSFDEALLSGLARDGGLYVPERWPSLDVAALAGMSYADIARTVLAPFTGATISERELDRLLRASLEPFGHQAITPLVQVDATTFLLELFHGPTLAFKDVALQLLGQLFDHVLERRGERITIVGATSGDTGSAAIEACKDRARIDLVILYPHGRVSEVQRRQMTCVSADNVRAIAIDGTFDDCQDLVKAMFNDHAFRDRLNLSAVNSINVARVLAQSVYYVVAAVALGAPKRSMRFVVPTGNFGNVFAGYAAKAMGLPVERLVVASNANDILTRFIGDGAMEVRSVVPTLSPSMDIQISSNAERLLFDLLDRDGHALAGWMRGFRASGRAVLPDAGRTRLVDGFSAGRVDDARTLAQIAQTLRTTGLLVDPHTAVGLAVASDMRPPEDSGVPTVVLATAHPAKFPDAVERATGRRPGLPDRMADLYQRPERTSLLPNDLAAVQAYVLGHSRAAAAA